MMLWWWDQNGDLMTWGMRDDGMRSHCHDDMGNGTKLWGQCCKRWCNTNLLSQGDHKEVCLKDGQGWQHKIYIFESNNLYPDWRLSVLYEYNHIIICILVEGETYKSNRGHGSHWEVDQVRAWNTEKAFTVNLNRILSLFINLWFWQLSLNLILSLFITLWFWQLSATRDIGDVHRSKPPPTVHYQKAMPDVDDLMQVFFLISKLQRSSTKHMFLLKRGQTKCIWNKIYPNNHPSPLPKIG